MRKGLALSVLFAVLVLFSACQPKYVFVPVPEYPGSDEGGNVAVLSEKEIAARYLDEFSPFQALADSFDGRSDIWNEIDDGNTRLLPEVVTVRVYFDKYQQTSDSLIINDGYIVFTLYPKTYSTSDGKVNMNISVPEGIQLETPEGQIVDGLKISETSLRTEAVSVSSGSESGIDISVIDTDVMFPETAVATTDKMGNDTLMKAEADLQVIDIEPFAAIQDFDLFSILTDFISTRVGKYPEGMSILAAEMVNDEYAEYTLQLSSYPVGEYEITGTVVINFTLDGNHIKGAFTANSSGDMIVKLAGSNEGFSISMSGASGTATGSINNSLGFTYGGYVYPDTTSEFIINGKAVKESDLFGDGTAENPYKIYSIDQLRMFMQGSLSTGSFIDANYVLIGNIDAESDSSKWLERYVEIPELNGKFNGNGYAIQNLSIDFFKGLFSVGENGIVENLKFENAELKTSDITNATVNFGLFPVNDGIIRNVVVDDDSSVSVDFNGLYFSSDIGGLVGVNNGEIDTVYNGADITISNTPSSNSIMYAGGIAGKSSGSITNAINTGNIIITNDQMRFFYIGGIAGGIVDGSVEDSVNSGEVKGSVAAGGIFGAGAQACDASINNVMNSGSVSARDAAGGIGGLIITSGDIVAATNSGSVSGVSASGIVGRFEGVYSGEISIKGAVNTGTVEGTEEEDGIMIYNSSMSAPASITAVCTVENSIGTESVTVTEAYYTNADGKAVSATDESSAGISWIDAQNAMNSELTCGGFELSGATENSMPKLPDIEINIPVLNS